MNDYKLRFIPLGGVVGVTKNMYVYELHKRTIDGKWKIEDILIVDCGIGFPKEQELGVDLVIPDVSYLLDKKDKIRGVVLSHGHEDHTSALPYHFESLGRPQIFGSKLTSVFVENKFKEFGQKVRVNQVVYGKEYAFGSFRVSFIPVTHSIPDTLHVLIKTPVGNIYHGTDFKFDLTPPYGTPPDFYSITKAGNEGVLCLLSDCLGSEREGLTLSENIIGETFEEEMRKTKGRFIMTTFSSNISRIRSCVEAAIKLNRRIVFLGRSMRENTRLASEIGYLPIPHGLLIKEEEVVKFPPDKLCLIVAGSQGQFDSALSKLATNQNKNIKVGGGDKVIFSSDPIPGNEDEVYRVIEELAQLGADVVYGDIHDQLHASGHGNQEDLKFLVRFTNPRYFIPIGGTLRHQRQYLNIVTEMGFKQSQVFLLDEGETIWFDKEKATPGDHVETKNIFVDAYGIGDVGRVILRDRKTLSTEGMVVAILAIDQHGKTVLKPKLITRGFVFEKGGSELLGKATRMIEHLLKPRSGIIIDLGNFKSQIGKQLEDFFFRETGRKPLIIVDVIET